MKIAIMQPYIFPYIGYFQLIRSVDKFVFYDDVAFIKNGWINRNRILVNGIDQYFSIPIKNMSSFTRIKDTIINYDNYSRFKDKFLKTINQYYRKAPFFTEVEPLLESVLNKNVSSISEIAIDSVMKVCKYLEIDTEIILSSSIFDNTEFKKELRIMDICKKLNANQYINMIGGSELYDKEAFKLEGITLNFLKPKPVEYKQFNESFVPWLSILDVLMFNEKNEVMTIIEAYDLI